MLHPGQQVPGVGQPRQDNPVRLPPACQAGRRLLLFCRRVPDRPYRAALLYSQHVRIVFSALKSFFSTVSAPSARNFQNFLRANCQQSIKPHNPPPAPFRPAPHTTRHSYWNTATGKCQCGLKGHTNQVLSVSAGVRSDGARMLLSASADASVRVWQA